jgi:hypothetical protein
MLEQSTHPNENKCQILRRGTIRVLHRVLLTIPNLPQKLEFFDFYCWIDMTL